MSGINAALEIENVYVSYCRQSARSPSLNPHSYTFYYFLPQQLWLLTPSQAIFLLVFLPVLSESEHMN